jgi:aminobenzoyl-glutamate transport protein
MHDHTPTPTNGTPGKKSWLDVIEWLGNKLPEPVLLFAMLAVAAVIVSGVGAGAGWRVQPLQPTVELVQKVDDTGRLIQDDDGKPVMVPKLDEKTGRPEVTLQAIGEPIEVKSLMTRDGVYWMLSSMVRNFVNFPPLGLVMTSMLGIGVAEKVGLFGAFMRWLAGLTPRRLLTPVVLFLGCNASIASDAGYIILPPLAAGLYATMGRSPLAGLAASFAGVAGGFGAGLFITGADTVLAGVATAAAGIVDQAVVVNPTVNWFFKAGSVPVIVLVGWFLTDRVVEPRLRRVGGVAIPPEIAATTGQFALSGAEKRGLVIAGAALVLALGVFIAMIGVEGWPLHGQGQPTLANGTPAPNERAGARWSQVIVPMMFFVFLAPGLAYGIATGTMRKQQDVVEAFYSAVRGIAPVIAMNFFAAQFLEYFKYSNLDRMLAYTGGEMLVRADMPVPVLIVLFVLFVIAADFVMSSMTAKFTLLAPILVPMFMMVGISPGLTMGAYRIGDSVVNTITPLNTYLPILLLVLMKYKKDAGLGSLMALMMPYSIAFGVAWTALLLGWYFFGAPLGPGVPMHYTPGQ